MKNRFLLLFLIAVCIGTVAKGQQRGIGLHFGAYDFYGPQTDQYLTSDRVGYEYIDTANVYVTSRHKHFYWNPMVKMTYWFQVNRFIDVNLGLSLANLEYPQGMPDSEYINKYFYNMAGEKRQKFLGELDVRVNYSILPRGSFIVSPYLFAGVNASFHDIFFGADVPLGLGFNINLSKDKNLSLNLESAYKVSVTDHDQNHLQHSIGFVYWFKKGYHTPSKKVAEMPPVVPPVMDSDGDGINDDEDECPSVAGLAQFNGCPDSDNDGIPDNKDECPLVAGLAAFNGCPDTDGDGIPDNKDKCPYVAGPADRQGCPVPDRDNDGFPDDVDRCPDAYSKTNGGCPEIRKEIITQVEKAAKAIFFETGKATIKKASYAQLDIVVGIMKSDPTLYADIEGHTDNAKPKTYTNMELSQKRAEAVRDYFASKGVDAGRMTAQGFGDTQPVADNKTAPGRAQNRRTVIKLRNYSK